MGDFAHDLGLGVFLLGFIFGFGLVFLEAGVVLTDEAFDLVGLAVMLFCLLKECVRRQTCGLSSRYPWCRLFYFESAFSVVLGWWLEEAQIEYLS